MGTQGPGRKRIPNRDKLAAEEDALSQIAREAEARLAAKRAARAEAREIRMKELERQQKELFHSTKKYYGLDNKWGHIEQWMEDSERYSRLSRRHTSISDDEEKMSVGSRGSYRVEERTDREFTDKGSRTASTLSAATLASLGGASSRRGSCDTSFSVETEASIREMKDSLAEAEEKYRRAMVSNAQLHNDKTALMFQVENLMEELSDVEELLWEARRRWDDATKELERERQAHSVLKVQFKQTEETLRQTNELLMEVSDLRQKSSSYRQEISDLQEALQWKEKKIAALERHREISDIVRIERDRLTDEVVQLRDSLKSHGVVVSPDTATNGDADQTEEESPSQLAEDSPHSGRESMLGKASQQKPADGSKDPQNVPKDKKRSLPQSMISVSDQTKPSRERRNPTEKHPGRNRQIRSKGGAKDPPKKLPVRADGNEAKKKQPSNEDPSQKVFRSRLVPPRPAKDIILDNRAMVLGLSAAEKINSPSEEAVKQDVSLALQSESSSSVTNFEQKHLSTSDLDSQSQDEDRNAEDDVSGVSEEGSSLQAAAESNKSKVEAVGGEEGSIRRTEASPETKVHFTSPENQSIGEPPQRAAEVHKACPESPKRTPPFVPEEMWTSLEMNVQHLLQGLEDKPGFVVEISRIFSEILMYLHFWSSDLENTLRNRAGRGSCLNDRGGHESMWPLRGTKLSTWLLTSLTRETAEGPDDGHLAGCSSSPRVSSAREKMEDPSGSTSRVCSTCHDQSTTNDEREIRSSPRDVQLHTESEASPPGSLLKSISGDFVFVESHFSESYKNSTDSRPDSKTHVLTSAKDSKEFRRNHPSSAHSSFGQSSSGGLKRFMEVTAEEIRALAVPELTLVGLQEGQRLDRSSVGSFEELSVGEMDSCEEADEDEVQLLPSQQQNLLTMEAEVQVIAPSLGTMEPETEHEESGLDSRKNDNTDCKIS